MRCILLNDSDEEDKQRKHDDLYYGVGRQTHPGPSNDIKGRTETDREVVEPD